MIGKINILVKKAALKGFCLLLVLAFLIQLCTINVLANDSSVPKHIPRVVSIVFDDSGSMCSGTERWAYSSYAMQAFTAMMSEEDVLFVTFINEEKNPQTVKLTPSSKQKSIDEFEKIPIGGSTPYKVDVGAEALEKEYSRRGSNAKYYLVVMADGELDGKYLEDAEDSLEKKIEGVNNQMKAKIKDADFETIYFSMKDEEKPVIPGVNCEATSKSNEIVEVLRGISAEIMGRNDITKECTYSDGKLSFELKYPALSVAFVVQKENGVFENVSLSMEKDGNNVSYDIDTFYVECPTEITFRKGFSYDARSPEDPPRGFVSLVKNDKGSVAKGKYVVDISASGLAKKNITVLVEPAVKIGCKYYINNELIPYDFDEFMEKVKAGDLVIVECGLYEINPDGTLGDIIPNDVLSPEYDITIDGTPLKENQNGKENRYSFEITEDHEGKELKIEAELDGYLPFILKEKFPKVNPRPFIDTESPDYITEISITKPIWKSWREGKGEIVFPLNVVNDDFLQNHSIEINGFSGIDGGKCSDLGNNIKVKSNKIIFIPNVSADCADKSFGQLFDGIDKFDVALKNTSDSNVLMTVSVSVIKPVYTLELTNQLDGVELTADMLGTNEKYVSFALMADYEADGTFQVVDTECEDDFSLTLNKGDLTGIIENNGGVLKFTPRYDKTVDTVPLGTILGKDHVVKVVATVDGNEVCSEQITISTKQFSYMVSVQNNINGILNLDSIKTNKENVVFSIMADYDGDGDFEELEEWDSSMYDRLVINSGDLPGVTDWLFSQGGKIIGRTFTPVYDENNNGGVVFTKVAGHIHKVTATISEIDAKAETEIEVAAPKYDIVVLKSNISFDDTKLRKNTKDVRFAIYRDNRPLTKEEIEGLFPYNLALDKDEDRIILKTSVGDEGDGAYLSVVPTCEKFIGDWTNVLFISKGKNNITLTVGADSATATFKVGMDFLCAIILTAILIVLIIVLWIIICFFTRQKFCKGELHLFRLEEDRLAGIKYVSGETYRYTFSDSIRSFFRGNIFFPSSKQSWEITVMPDGLTPCTLKFVTDDRESYPNLVMDKKTREKFFMASFSTSDRELFSKHSSYGVHAGEKMNITIVKVVPLSSDDKENLEEMRDGRCLVYENEPRRMAVMVFHEYDENDSEFESNSKE